MAPSCVPATALATSGSQISVEDLRKLLDNNAACGLAEVMNFPAVIAGEQNMLAKLHVMSGHPIDGHCPNVTGKSLSEYVAAGIGSDHESVTTPKHAKNFRAVYIY